MAVMRMFPLGSVLLPGAVLPLHVFEPRYRQLVVDCLADDTGEPEFGVALIVRGWEVGGGDQRADVAVAARIVQVEALEGGRYAVVAVGTRRLRINAWLPDSPYPIAEVEDWPDDEADATGAELDAGLIAAAERLRAVLALAAELGYAIPDVDLDEPADDLVAATYRLAGIAPLGAADRYRLLSAPTPQRRLELLVDSLDDVEAMLRFRLGAGDASGDA